MRLIQRLSAKKDSLDLCEGMGPSQRDRSPPSGPSELVQSPSQGTMAEWLTREIRNLFLSEGAGSNPAGVGSFWPNLQSIWVRGSMEDRGTGTRRRGGVQWHIFANMQLI